MATLGMKHLHTGRMITMKLITTRARVTCMYVISEHSMLYKHSMPHSRSIYLAIGTLSVAHLRADTHLWPDSPWQQSTGLRSVALYTAVYNISLKVKPWCHCTRFFMKGHAPPATNNSCMCHVSLVHSASLIFLCHQNRTRKLQLARTAPINGTQKATRPWHSVTTLATPSGANTWFHEVLWFQTWVQKDIT